MPNPLGKNGESTYADQEPDLTETERVIFKRRSVRLYKKKKVSRELIARVIEAGRFAPSAGNNQPWKFVVIDNPDILAMLNKKCKASLYKVSALTLPKPWINKKTPGDKNADLAMWQKAVLPLLTKVKTGDTEPRARGGINAASSDPNYDIFFGAPAVILLLADKRGIGSVELDTGIAGQTMVLAAHSLGLGTCWVSLAKAIGFDKKLCRKLGIEEPFKIISSLTLGYPQGQVGQSRSPGTAPHSLGGFHLVPEQPVFKGANLPKCAPFFLSSQWAVAENPPWNPHGLLMESACGIPGGCI